jgi:hypothetical protein
LINNINNLIKVSAWKINLISEVRKTPCQVSQPTKMNYIWKEGAEAPETLRVHQKYYQETN